MKPSERSIQRAIMEHFWASFQCACPNFTPRDWWECDIWAVTKAGYVAEYEIKLSASDFWADRRKSRNRYDYSERGIVTENKHDRLSLRDSVPSRFFFVVPEAIEDTVSSNLPDFAGLIVVRERYGRWGGLRIKRFAPRLHKNKVADGEIPLAMKAIYYRYHEALRTIDDMKQREATP